MEGSCGSGGLLGCRGPVLGMTTWIETDNFQEGRTNKQNRKKSFDLEKRLRGRTNLRSSDDLGTNGKEEQTHRANERTNRLKALRVSDTEAVRRATGRPNKFKYAVGRFLRLDVSGHTKTTSAAKPMVVGD